MNINRIPRAYSGAQPAPSLSYVELSPIFITPSTAGSWTAYNLNSHGIPKGAVVEIYAANKDSANEYYGGVRNVGSALDRRIQLVKAETADSYSTVRMLSTVNTSGEVEYYAENTSSIVFIIMGYWEGATFTERFDSIDNGTANAWTDYNLNSNFSTPVNQVYDIAICNSSTAERYAGVRANGSSLARYYDLGRAEGGGETCYNMFVKADASGIIEVFEEVTADIHCYSMGYWDTTLDYQELFEDISPSNSATWENKDISSYITDALFVESTLMQSTTASQKYNAGTRVNGSSQDRYFASLSLGNNAAFRGGYAVTCNVDSAGFIQVYAGDDSKAYFNLIGYFK